MNTREAVAAISLIRQKASLVKPRLGQVMFIHNSGCSVRREERWIPKR